MNFLEEWKRGDDLKKGIIHTIMILVLCCIIAKPVSAFAGGGGADYNGGGGNGGHTGATTNNDHWSDQSDTSDRRNSHPLTFLFPLGIGAIILLANRKKFHQRSSNRTEIDILNYQDPEEVAIDQLIEEIFYPIQKAWQIQDLSSVEKYYSKELLQLHTKKIEKMQRKHHKNIIEDLVLRKVGNLHWMEGHAEFSVEIEARAIDYVIDTRSNQVIKGRKGEYGLLREKWFFQKNEAGSWMLYQIK